jgi:D-alanyl-lipoteichoic acid acyltransferase DltB (MBOAT superfamily)
MVFSSFEFLFVFLPIAFFGGAFFFLKKMEAGAIAFVVFCSLIFYSYWNALHILVIVSSLSVNHFVSGLLTSEKKETQKSIILFFGVGFNLGMLGYFKYMGFFSNIFTATDASSFFDNILNTALPIGISFYTFQQIAYLVDCRRHQQRRPYNFLRYAFFVTFFPQLIAGPIVHHSEIMPQLEHLGQRLRGSRYVVRYLSPGLAILIIGLTKKIAIADTFGIFADQSFAAGHVANLTFLDAWSGASAYTLQIYFDFSGYSDMAIGLGLLFGLRLPVNFLSPYKATSIINFWRRWHITLSRFLRHYLYFPLGGNRLGAARRHGNLLLTMLLGGLWHGANWTFVFWGGLHGGLLAANHALRRYSTWRPPVWLAVPITFMIVMLAWVPFRAETFPDAIQFYKVMFGREGIILPWRFSPLIEWLGPVSDVLSLQTGNVRYFSGMRQVVATVIALGIVFFGPCSMSLMDSKHRQKAMRSRWVPYGLGASIVMVLFLMSVRTNTTFLYFQF